MKRFNIFLVLALCASITAVSCKKEGCKDPEAINYNEDAKKDDGTCEYEEEKETILTASIVTPTMGQTFGLGDTVKINVTATGSEDLHGCTFKIINTSVTPNDTVYTAMAHDHGLSIDVHEEWINNVSMHSDMILEVEVLGDHDGEQTKVVTQSFHCHPM